MIDIQSEIMLELFIYIYFVARQNLRTIYINLLYQLNQVIKRR